VTIRLSLTTVWVLDQDSAKSFYTEKLGFDLKADISMGDEFEGAGAGFRWLTVSPPGQPEQSIVLADCSMGHDPESAEQVRALVAKGALGPGGLSTDDAKRTYEELSGRGVEFIQEPAERPYGIEAVLRDDSGNLWSMVQATEMAG